MLDIKPDPDAMLTGAQAARHIGVRKQRIRAWRHAGKLAPAGFTEAGAPLYRQDDVLQAEQRSRSNPRSPRYAPRPEADAT